MYIKELTNEEFNNFTAEFPYKTFYQTPEYAFVMSREKNEVFLLGLVDDKFILAAAVIIVEKRSGFKYAYTPRGFLINFNDYTILEQFTKLLKEYYNQAISMVEFREADENEKETGKTLTLKKI